MLMTERMTAVKANMKISRALSVAVSAALLAVSLTGPGFAAEPETTPAKYTPLKSAPSTSAPSTSASSVSEKEAESQASTGTKFSTVRKAVDYVTSKTGTAPAADKTAADKTTAADAGKTTTEATVDLTPAMTAEQATAAAAYAVREAKRQAATMQAEALHNEALDHYELARVYLGQWNAEMAEIELQAAVMCEPGIKAVHRDYVFVALMRANIMKAIAEAMMVVGLGEPIPLDDAQKEKLKESACKAHYIKGIAAARETKWKDAITEFQWALSYQPNNARVSRSMAFAYASLGDFNKAEKEYAASFAMDPSDAFAHADLAFLLEKAGNTNKAMEQLEEAVKLQPNVAALHVDLAWLAESKGDLNRASAEFEEAVKLSPKHAALWTHLGKLFARQGLSDRAIDAYKAALDLDPEQQDAEQGLHLLEPATKPNANKA